jgi:lipopolysaccharide assembly outer membrane protein LptD (OstA)
MRCTLLLVGLLLGVPGPGAGQTTPPPPSAAAPAATAPAAPGLATARAAPSPVAPAAALADTALSRAFHLQAGRGRVFVENGERVSILEGGVRLTSDSTTIDSDWARAYRARELAYFFDHVVVHDRRVTMTGERGEFSRPADYAALSGHVRIDDPRGVVHADRARYERSARRLWLWGSVDFQDPKTRVQADSVLYHEDTGVGDAFGSVIVTDVATGSEARGPHATYDRNSGVARLEETPHMVVREAGSADTRVDAAVLLVNRAQTEVRARGDVRIRRGATIASADSAFLYKDRDLIQLRGRPQVQQENTTMRGREIDAFYRDHDLERVAVRGSAHLLRARQDTLLVQGQNEVHGDSASLFFDAGELRRAVVVGHARSRYVPVESRSNRISLNEAEADSIVMLFEKQEVQEVLFIGTASGTYRYFEGDLEALRRPVEARLDTTYGVVRGDTTHFDFLKRATPVVYSAERILYLAPQNDLVLQKAAEVQYEGRTLRAGRIRYDADTDVLEAAERPALDDAGSRMYGESMGYDMETRQAWIRGASTQFDQGFYTGRVLRKEPDDVMQVSNSSYTTCDLLHPHYRFQIQQMKIYMHDKMVGRPVVLYLGRVPVGYLPFFVNSVSTSRHSGFMQPDIQIGVGTSSRYIHGLDYYWAASRYFDFLFSGSYTEQSRPDRSSLSAFEASTQTDTRSVGLRMHSRYKWRYHFEGNVDYSFQRQLGTDDVYWTLGGAHSQTIGERTTLRGNLNYSSSLSAQYQVNQNYSYAQSLRQQITSGLGLSRRGDLLTVSANIGRVQQLDPTEQRTGTIVTSTLPQLSLSFRAIRLGPAPLDAAHPGWRGFLHDLQFVPNLAVSRVTTQTRIRRPVSEIPPEGVAAADSFRIIDNEVIRAATHGDLGRPASVGFLSLTPSLGFGESYLRDKSQPQAKNNTFSLTTSLGASTTFYGIFRPHRWGINAIRHRIDPRATATYVPEIAGQQSRSLGVGLSLSNQIDAKVQRGKNERRIDGLLDWSLATAWVQNPATTPGQLVRNFSNISSQITVNRSGPFRLGISQTYDPYARKVLETRIPFNFALRGKFGYGDAAVPEQEERNRVIEEEGETVSPADSLANPVRQERDGTDALADIRPREVGKNKDGPLGWDLVLGYSLVHTASNNPNALVSIGFGIDVTRNWHMTYNASYDAQQHRMASPAMRLTRDLHCWKASFARIYDPYQGWRYYLRVWVDRHQTDLFFESGQRNLGY